MDRILEEEVMVNSDSAKAFEHADFERLHFMIMEKINKTYPTRDFNSILDLGCGPCTFEEKLLKSYQNSKIYCVDASKAMLEFANKRMKQYIDIGRIQLLHEYLPTTKIPKIKYDLIIAINFLHHLPEPGVLWNTIKQYGEAGTAIVVMDLIRPNSKDGAEDIVNRVSKDETKIMREDHYNSLLASFTINEVKEQLKDAEMLNNLNIIDTKSHMFITGIL